MKKYHQFNFEGIVIKVPSKYDNVSGRYISEIPDFEEHPLYTSSGKPLVTAVQDACCYMTNITDCGSCEFYQPNNAGDLIGVCINPQNILKKEVTNL